MTSKEIQKTNRDTIGDFLAKQEDHFSHLNAQTQNKLTFAKEAEFALQALTGNEYLLGVGRANQDSLKAAIANVAAIGITLNPALAYAYLVPRKVGKAPSVCLDISYRGLIKLATDSGVIKAMKAEMVFSNDHFEYNGFHEKPIFSADPFEERGELKGIYAMALMRDGSYLVETMTVGEINAIRDDSEAYKSALSKGEDSWQYKNCVWVKYYGEMAKKTVIKRAYKTLPTSQGMEIMGKAIEVLNEHEGITFKEPEKLETYYTDGELNEYKRCVEDGDFFNLVALIGSLCAESQMSLKALCVPEPPKGTKMKAADKWRETLKHSSMEVESTLALLREALEDDDDAGAMELLSECSTWTLDYLAKQLLVEHQIIMRRLLEIDHEPV